MHVLINSSPVEIRGQGVTLPPGEWLMQDGHAFNAAGGAARGSVKIMPWEGRDEVVDVTSILLIRSGAIGDLLLLTPAIRALKNKHPHAQIWLSCFKKHWDIFAQGDTHFIEYPLPLSALHNFDLIIPLENIVEDSTEKGVHATDAYADALGVTVTDYRPVYKMTVDELRIAIENHGRAFSRKPRVALQLRASARIRDYHMELWGEVINGLLSRGWEVMLIGKENPDITGMPPELKDLSRLSFREVAAVLSTCDVFCGVDSSFFNLCPALNVPAIGLFGPVDWRTRVKEGNGQRALTGVGECAPCGWTNSRAGQKFPPTCPSREKGYCEVLATIKPERVISLIDAYRK